MRNLIVALLLTLPAFAAPPARAPVVPDKIADQFTPAAFDRQHIEGILGERMRVNLEGRLLRVDETALIDCFQHRPGPQDWAGEHAGKFLHAAANTWLAGTKNNISSIAAVLNACSAELGLYPMSVVAG